MAIIFSAALLAFFFFVGVSVVQLCAIWTNPLRPLLIAPVAGAATLVLPLFVLNRLNFPVRQFALPMTILLGLGAAVVWWRKRPSVPLRQLLPFALIVALAGVLAGYPLARFGFNWMSYGNSDVSMYVMAAHRFADHGYYQLPDAAALLQNRDYGSSYWFCYAIEGLRSGSDLLLAWLISLTHLSGFQIYMPLTLVLHLGLISAVAALVLRDDSLRLAALVSSAWVAISPLNTLGAMYQLLPQVFGIGLLVVCAAILLEPVKIRGARDCARFSSLAGSMVAALMIVYYQVLPFLLLPVAAYHGVLLLARRESMRTLAAPAFATLAVVAVLLRTWIFAFVPFLRYDASRSFGGVNPNASAFPYFLVPSGLANLWGFLPIGGSASSARELNIAIAAGGLLLLAAIAATIWQALKGQPAALIALVMLAAGADLFLHGGDFGLFKLAMYIQPFLLSALVLAWFQLSRLWLRG